MSGLSQTEVARRLGVSRRCVRHIERRALAKLRGEKSKRGTYRCSLCGEQGHTVRTCGTPHLHRAIAGCACIGCNVVRRLLSGYGDFKIGGAA